MHLPRKVSRFQDVIFKFQRWYQANFVHLTLPAQHTACWPYQGGKEPIQQRVPTYSCASVFNTSCNLVRNTHATSNKIHQTPPKSDHQAQTFVQQVLAIYFQRFLQMLYVDVSLLSLNILLARLSDRVYLTVFFSSPWLSQEVSLPLSFCDQSFGTVTYTSPYNAASALKLAA